MEIKPGLRLRSQVCDTEIMVVRAPSTPIELTCGGHPVVAMTDEPAGGLSLTAGLDTGSQLGKRYTSAADDGLELLVTKAGAGTLAEGSTPLVLKEAKPLPSSD